MSSHHPVRASTTVGRHELDAGGADGTRVATALYPGGDRELAALSAAVANAARRIAERAEPFRGGGGVALETADAAVGRLAGAVDQLRRIGAGLEAAPPDVTADLALLAPALDRLDGERRYRELLSLAREAEVVLLLAHRFEDTVHALELTAHGARALTGEAPQLGRSSEAWALHELGVLAVTTGQSDLAVGLLGQAIELRRGLGEAAGMQLSQTVLAAVPPAAAAAASAAPSPVRPVAAQAPPKRHRLLLWLTALVAALLLGGVAGAALQSSSEDTTTEVSTVEKTVTEAGSGAAETVTEEVPTTVVETVDTSTTAATTG